MHISVITATWNRPSQLAACLHQWAAQARGGLEAEMIVVSDGPDPRAAALAQAAGVRFHAREATGGRYGVYAKDAGLALARGDYVCFWDDDNLYEPHALTTLYAAAYGVDLGIVQVRHLDRPTGTLHVIPRTNTNPFRLGNVDTLCLCLRREFALQEAWSGSDAPRNTDHDWLTRLQRHTPKTRLVPIIIGTHL